MSVAPHSVILSHFRTTDATINHAVERNASDIHITPTATGFQVQFRSHGVLSQAIEIKHEAGRSLIQAFKAEGKMNIAETRRPQDARLTKNNFELRLATHPTLHGENLVIRLLTMHGKKHLTDLGLCQQAKNQIEELLLHENGLMLVAGPTGSGKTTTLHAMLNTLGTKAGRIATLEDPVEIVNSNAMQTDLSRLPHLDFSTGLRSLMRQDPDTILVGEIRDEATAELTLNAALTGHRVFASIHAPDCLGALCRLVELDVRFGSLLICLNGIVTLRLRTMADHESRQLLAEVMNLKNMDRPSILKCTSIDQLTQLCTNRSYLPFSCH